ncbi:MAG: hypothetical protein EBV23_14580, partial [Flavobacteriia bacterium]|nr:hypothetical protein [Flavobacteriia bacterium]
LNTVGTTILEYKFGNETVTKEIRVVGSKDDFDALRANGYTKSISSKVTSRQDARRYQFNSLSKGYIANNKTYSKMDEARFKILDDINALLDTAIYLQNQDKIMEASAYLEKVLFGGVSSKISIEDYRNQKASSNNWYLGKFATDVTSAQIENNGFTYSTVDITSLDNIGVYYMSERDPSQSTARIIAGSVFAGSIPDGKIKPSTDTSYLKTMLPGFENDPNIATWIMTLRNGLSEHTIESRGKQRWRNVTEEENIGRLNYRKDDYIDYLDGDLESSIFYNNQKRINDINAGRLSAKNTVYQSEHENRDLEGNLLSPTSSGWPTTLISDKSKVYKGGSWADRAYWLSAGNRRFMDQDKTS